ncbi:MAG TPA: type I-U CRISPR-associated protein Csb2 [Candidatus Dormibacteraeota bacterium]|nr:type I-U CRISPR-associated protein Csb2 [Candidatus Dormibacteraeota bacterium]
MLAIDVEYLTGRCVAARLDDRDQPEWPPHPARLFAALVAVAKEAGDDPRERAALEWLERQAPPTIAASEATQRRILPVFVPVNDDKHLDGKVAPPTSPTYPIPRVRQPRTFPSVTPDCPLVQFAWPAADPDEATQAAISGLLARLVYLGHSSSLVRAVLSPRPLPPIWQPGEPSRDGQVLRVPAPGLLVRLEEVYEVFTRTGIRQQVPGRPVTYRRVEPSRDRTVPPATCFGTMLVFRRDQGPRYPILAAERVAATLRDAVMAACDQPVPEVLSGHTQDGAPSRRPHAAYVALPAVGDRHLDGHLVGVAVALPRDLASEERVLAERALGRVEQLTFGRAGTWRVAPSDTTELVRALQPWRWTGPARGWATVTPVELDGFPDDRYGPDTAAMVARACRRIGLPEPVEVVVGPVSVVPGVPPAGRFVGWRVPRPGPRRPLVHAVIRFSDPVLGPVLLGAGRYRGLGLCRPSRTDGRRSRAELG